MASSTTTLERKTDTKTHHKLVDKDSMSEKINYFRFIKEEPIGTITNVAFLVVAIFIGLHADGRFTALVTSLTLLFIGSTAFHANGSRENVIPHWADVGFLYAVAGAMVFHIWGETLWVLIAAMIVVGIFTLFVGSISAVIPVGIATVLIAVGIGINVGWSATFIPLGLAIGGYAIRFYSEKTERWHDLLHGLWHILIAGAVYTAWLTVRFEEPYTACALWLSC